MRQDCRLLVNAVINRKIAFVFRGAALLAAVLCFLFDKVVDECMNCSSVMNLKMDGRCEGDRSGINRGQAEAFLSNLHSVQCGFLDSR